MHDPENIHLVTHELRLGLFHQQIEQRLLAMRLKLVAVSMIEKLDVVLRQRFARFVENFNSFAAGLLVKLSLVRDPGATGILQPKSLSIFGDALNIIAIFLERKMAFFFSSRRRHT